MEIFWILDLDLHNNTGGMLFITRFAPRYDVFNALKLFTPDEVETF